MKNCVKNKKNEELRTSNLITIYKKQSTHGKYTHKRSKDFDETRLMKMAEINHLTKP
jgi:hypothetical protein